MTKAGVAAVWAPRVAGIALVLFLSLFAFEAFNGKSFAAGFPAFLINLAPAGIVAAVLAVAWRVPVFGAAGFALLALGYALAVRSRLDWVAVISGPLAIVAVLFFLSRRHHSSHVN